MLMAVAQSKGFCSQIPVGNGSSKKVKQVWLQNLSEPSKCKHTLGISKKQCRNLYALSIWSRLGFLRNTDEINSQEHQSGVKWAQDFSAVALLTFGAESFFLGRATYSMHVGCALALTH